jgi:hypothetical protein
MEKAYYERHDGRWNVWKYINNELKVIAAFKFFFQVEYYAREKGLELIML